LIPILHYIIISSILFSIGVAIVITKRNVVVVLAGIELILNAANINLVAFSSQDGSTLKGHMLTLFVMVVAAAEVTVALAIIMQVYKFFKSTNLDEISKLKD